MSETESRLIDKEICVLVHGFTGLPLELDPLAAALGQRGFDVLSPSLAGHDGTIAGLRGISATDWIESVAVPVRDALERGPVHLIGFSMGALIAVLVEIELPVCSLVMLAPAIHYARPRLVLRQADVFVRGRLQKESTEAAYLEKRPSGFLLTPPRSLDQFRQTVKMAKLALPRVAAPACIIQGDRDEIVDPVSSNYAYAHIGSMHREVHHLPRSRHHVCLDVEADNVIDLVAQFLASPAVRAQVDAYAGVHPIRRMESDSPGDPAGGNGSRSR